MSKGAGKIERRIADLFAATRDKALSVDEITDSAYQLHGAKPTREQRLAATRAAHRLLRRVRETIALSRKLMASDDWERGRQLYESAGRVGHWVRIVEIEGRRGAYRGEDDFWQAATVNRRLFFHPPDVPVIVWAVKIQADGVHWFETDVIRVTEKNVVVAYAGEKARLDRIRLFYWWAFWRGVMFVSSQTGRIAAALEEHWREQYGRNNPIPLAMKVPLADAMALLGVKADFTREDVIAAFRRKAKLAHPDLGGTPELFRALVEARDRLLAAIGTKEAPPKPPNYAPSGTKLVYGSGSSRANRLAANARRLLR